MFRHVKSALSLVFLLLGAPMVLAQGKDVAPIARPYAADGE